MRLSVSSKYLSVNRVLSILFITACNNSDTPSSPPRVRSFEIFGELVQRNGEVTDGVLTNTRDIGRIPIDHRINPKRLPG